MEIDLNECLSLAHIRGGISIAGELTKSTARTKLITLLPMNLPRALSENGKDVLRKCYPADRQFLSFPTTRKIQKELDTFIRNRSGSDS